MRALARWRRAVTSGLTTRRASSWCCPDGTVLVLRGAAERLGRRALDHGVVLTEADAFAIAARLDGAEAPDA